MSYTRLLKHQDISLKVKSDPLTTAFIFLSIRPYTPESVKDYQRKLLEVFKKLTQERLEVESRRCQSLERITVRTTAILAKCGFDAPRFYLLCKIVFAVLVCRLFFPTAYAAVMLGNFQFLFNFFLFSSLAAIVAWVGIGKLYFSLTNLPSRLLDTLHDKVFSLQSTLQALSWRRAHCDFNMLNALGIVVPEPVQKLAREIKILAPRTQCFVEYLDTEPFLLASLNGVEYYVAVWDEPKYREEQIP